MLISMLLPDFRGGGMERVSLDLAQVFNSAGHEVEFVLMTAKGDFLSEARREYSVINLRVEKTRYVLWPLANYLRRRRPSALIAHMWPLTSAAVFARFLSRHTCRLLLVEHNTLSRQYASWGRIHNFGMRATMTATYRFADKVAAVSKGAALDTANLATLDPRQVNTIYNPIPQRQHPAVDELSKAEALWNCARGKRILTVGSLKDQKNHPLLFRALAKSAFMSAKLMLLGQGENEPMLRSLAAQLDISNRVIFAGFQKYPSAFYASADLFVLSSDYEGFGNVIVEALSFGLSVVSTDCPSGPAEILGNGRWGRLVPVGDADALCNAIEAALTVPVDRDDLKGRAANFSPEIAARKYLDLLGFK
jgi:glycosyltransferase involved in cell wall biosynthesis